MSIEAEPQPRLFRTVITEGRVGSSDMADMFVQIPLEFRDGQLPKSVSIQALRRAVEMTGMGEEYTDGAYAAIDAFEQSTNSSVEDPTVLIVSEMDGGDGYDAYYLLPAPGEVDEMAA